ncbi:MAG TPA: hypothetical protein PLD25_32020 [Chloroflexota bacterium]|nr:hypothetical protein [Chloroflexota bacterium]
MSEKSLTELSYDEFQSLVDGYIDHSSQESGEMSAPTFFELLFERMTERATQTIELEGEIIGNQLILRLPADIETAVQVQDNEIVVGDQRIVVKLKNYPVYPTAG